MSRRSQLALAASVVTAVAAGGTATAKRRIRAQRQAPDPAATPLAAAVPVDRVSEVATENGVLLHVEEVGPADASLTVVFSHGWVCTEETWTFQRQALTGDDIRLVFYDLRGHGRSGRPDPANTGIDILGRDLGRVIDAVRPAGEVVLVGHSMGGMTVMALADQRAELFVGAGPVAGVCLMSTSAGKLASVSLGLPAVLTHVTRRLLPRSYKTLMRFGDRFDARRPHGDLTWMLSRYLSFAGPVSPSLVGLMERMMAQAPLATTAGFGAALLSHDKLDALPALAHTSVLILVGAADVLTPVEHSQAMADALPDAELVVLPRCGHMAMLEAPDLVNAELEILFERARERARA